MKPYSMPLKNAYGRRAHSHHLKEMIGLDAKAKLPAHGMPQRVVQGVVIYVRALDPLRSARRQHRVRAICPGCGKDVSAGRLFSHVCK